MEDTPLKTAMLAYAPHLEDDYKKFVRSTFESMQKDLGTELKNVYNDWRWARTFTGAIRPNVKHPPSDTPYRINQSFIIDEEALAKNGKRYGHDTALEWYDKMHYKLGDLDNVKVSPPANNGHVKITGTHDGNNVEIVQDIIINQSKLGTLFHQFPSHIYVNGKFVSEAAYKNKVQSWGIEIKAPVKEKRDPIDPLSRPRKFYFKFKTELRDGRIMEDRDYARGMTEEEAKNKLIKSEMRGGYYIRLFDMQLDRIYAWNDSLLWKPTVETATISDNPYLAKAHSTPPISPRFRRLS